MIETNKIYNEACLETLRRMPDESIDCCVTSPPYFGLRDYGCDGQIGLESTPQEFVARLVEVFTEVRRVLKKDGTCWINLGDSYAGSGRGRDADGTWNPGKGGSKQETNIGAISGRVVSDNSFSRALIEKGAIGNAWVKPPAGYKQKDIMGIPWRVAFALQESGWWLRQDIIWSKPNPMPESVTDRCTKAHEYIFLLTKSAKYYYDSEAIKEPIKDSSVGRLNGRADGKVAVSTLEHADSSPYAKQQANRDRSLPRNRNGITGTLDVRHKNLDVAGRTAHSFHADRANGNEWESETAMANKKSVWTVTTRPFKEAHFATFPEALITPCVLAGSRPGGIVYDPFGGAGTTAVVSHKLGRNWILSELNSEYVGIAERRLEPLLMQENLFAQL